jgi:hypothetical protein
MAYTLVKLIMLGLLKWIRPNRASFSLIIVLPPSLGHGILPFMFFAYFDESGDAGLAAGSSTPAFTLSCSLIHDKDWHSALDAIVAYRRYLKANFRIFPRQEIKANYLLHNGGGLQDAGLSFSSRMAVFESAMRFQRKCGFFKVFSVVICKDKITVRTKDVRDTVWEYALQRLERFGVAKKDNIHVIPDEGHSDFIRKKIRKMRRSNYVRSAFGDGGLLERKLVNIIEDPSERKSHESNFIQLADLNAYASYRKVYPGPNFDGAYWDVLGDCRLTEVNQLRGGPLGIVSWP